MSEYDELRRAFDDLAAGPPLVLGRKEAVMSRVTRRLQRQALARGAGVLALAVALGTTAVSTSLHLQQTGSDGPATVVTEPTAEPSHSPAPRTEPSHEPSHSSTEPGSAPATEPSSSVEPTSAPEPSHRTEPTTAPASEPTHAAPSPENTAASGPLTVAVEMSPSNVDTSTDTHALVTARDGEGRLLAVDIDWGDGKTFHFSPPDAACPRTTHLDGSFVHRYSAAGTYAVHVTVTCGDCAPTEKVTRESHVSVTAPSPTYTNGPSQPTAGATDRAGDNPSYVYLNANGADADGYVRRIAVDWGDGSTDTVSEWSTSGCTNAAGSDHPGPTHHDANVSHHYANAGEHTVTITVTSVACDGTHAQTTSATRTVTSP